MRHDRIQNVLLAIIAAVLLLNVSDRLISPAHAVVNKRYQCVEVTTALEVQRTMDRAVADGWEYVGSIDHVLIFKRYFF
jgi:hypothetical protein